MRAHAFVFAALLALGSVGWARAAEPRATFEGVEDDGLRLLIERAIGETDRPVGTRFEARRRAQDAAEAAQAVLRSEGYYGAQVTPEIGEGDLPKATVKIILGPRFEIAGPKLEWVGQAPAPDVQAKAVEALKLPEGDPGRAADVIAAEGRAVASVQALGYADVAAAPREVVVDHADATVRPTFRLTAGELIRLNGIELVTEGRTNPDWVKGLAPWSGGQAYAPASVAELERRLLDTGVYDSVTVALAPKQKETSEGLRPVIVSLSDRPRRTLELGAGYSTSEGLGADARWTRYNVLRRADTITLAARAATIDSRLEGTVRLPHWRRPQEALTMGAAIFRTESDAYDELGAGVRADLERRYGKTSFRTLGGSIEFSRLDETRQQLAAAVSRGRDLLILTGLAALTLDRSDDPLDPKSGWRVDARAEPTFVTIDTTLPYLKVQAQGTYYLGFGKDKQTVLAARAKLGTIVGGNIPDVPTSRRFFSGGGGSVRGYAYQAIGPRLPNNDPQGGLSLVEGSLEVRHKFNRQWGFAAFVDAGAVGTDEYPTGGDFSLGVGVGVRYDLGFGPIRADIAVPIDRRQGDNAFQIYLSIGQSF